MALPLSQFLWQQSHPDWDPRNKNEIKEIIEKRESQSFRSELNSKKMGQNYWPGLKAFELSWIWLELLQGLNHKSSFGYDYSWLFS
jgi:hypothetical protein